MKSASIIIMGNKIRVGVRDYRTVSNCFYEYLFIFCTHNCSDDKKNMENAFYKPKCFFKSTTTNFVWSSEKSTLQSCAPSYRTGDSILAIALKFPICSTSRDRGAA